MVSLRSQLAKWVEDKHIDSANIDKALMLTGLYPSHKAWRTFLDQLLLWLGCLSLTFSVLFFIAYNWASLGQFVKFAMVESLIIASIIIYWRYANHLLISKVALLMATIFLGVLLALFGQTYQTGADTWQLFFTWSMLMLPWAFLSRFSVIWVLWLVLLNTVIMLYHHTFGDFFQVAFLSGSQLLWALFLFNMLALIIWEYLATKFDWLAERWAPRLIAVGSGVPIIILAIEAIFGRYRLLPLSICICFIAGLYLFYRHVRQDLFMLAGASLSGIIVIVSVCIDLLPENEAGFLLTAIIILGLGSSAAIWLKAINKEWAHA